MELMENLTLVELLLWENQIIALLAQLKGMLEPGMVMLLMLEWKLDTVMTIAFSH